MHNTYVVEAGVQYNGKGKKRDGKGKKKGKKGKRGPPLYMNRPILVA